MDSKARTPAERVYEDFEPTLEWAREAGTDTLIVYLPGFSKEQLKVQVTTARKLRLSGERPIDGKKWSRFRKEIPVPLNYDTNGFSAKFEKGILYVKHPKIIVQVEPPQEDKKEPVEPPGTPEKVQPPPEPSIPGPKRPTEQGKLEPSAEAPQRPQEAKTPRQEKVKPPPEAAIPGPEKPTVQGKLEPSAEAPPRPQKQSTEAEKPQQEKLQPPPEAAVPLKPPQEKGQPSREPSSSRPEEKPSTEKLNGATSQRTERDQPSIDSVLGAAEKDAESVKGAGKIESVSDGWFQREIFRRDYRGLLSKLMKQSKLIILVLCILLVVITVLYAMTALRSPSKSEN